MLLNELFLYKIPGDENIAASEKDIDHAIEDIFYQSGYDIENYGKDSWNPLREYITPGQNVLIKPNMVLEFSHQPGEDYYSVVTHPQIIRTVTKYVFRALQGRGKITIADAPINSANFRTLCTNMGLYELQKEYAQKGFLIELIDFRLYVMHKDENGIISEIRNSVDKTDYVEIKFDDYSALKEQDHNFKRFRVTEYDYKIMPAKHNTKDHRYCFHKAALEANVVISLPKIKTHRKAGLTCAMKNLVGLNGNKDYLPHHTKYSRQEGGDEYLYPSFRKKIISRLWEIRWRTKNKSIQHLIMRFENYIFLSSRIKPFKDNYFEGSWWGNKTISKTVCDLNRAILYSNVSGELQRTPQRKMLYLVDGIICGEGEGPMQATSKICNILVWGHNSLHIDCLVAELIGFDYNKIDTISSAVMLNEFKIVEDCIANAKVLSNVFKEKLLIEEIRKHISYNFEPPQKWKGYIEKNYS